MKTSVLLLSLNEAQNLPRCLDSLSWCDDIVLVDSGSTDETVGIARSRGVRVLTRPFDTFADQRNFGLEAGDFVHDWVLHLDADEVVTPAFRDALSACSAPDSVDAYRVPSKLILFDTWLRYSGMYPVYQVRLGRRDVLRFHQVGHGQRETTPPERLATFAEPYLHYSFSEGLSRWLIRHVRYASDESHLIRAEGSGSDWRSLFASDPVRRRRALKQLSSGLPVILRPLARFLYVYVVRRGFRDGSAGLTYATMLAVYEGMTVVLAREQRHADRQRPVPLGTTGGAP